MIPVCWLDRRGNSGTRGRLEAQARREDRPWGASQRKRERTGKTELSEHVVERKKKSLVVDLAEKKKEGREI